MATEQFANNAATTLSGNGGSITSGATSLIVANASGFPTTGNFRILIGSELILVGAVSGTTFSSLTRGLESTTAASHNDGDAVTHILTAASLIQAIADRSPLVLLESHTASASASLNFTTRNALGQSGATFQSDFDNYQVEITGLIAATNNTDLQMLVSTNGGTSWASTTYMWERSADFAGSAGSPGSAGSTSDSKFVLWPGLDSSIADACLDASLKIKHPLNSTLSLVFYGQQNSWYQPATPRYYIGGSIGGKYRTAAAVNAIQFKMSSGNIASGSIRLYGLGGQ